MLGHLVVGIVAGEGNEDHGHQRDHREHEQSQQRQGQEGDVELAVPQEGDVLFDAVGSAPDDGGLLQGVGFLHRAEVGQEKEQDDEDRKDPVQHDMEGVIPRDLDEFSQLGIPDVGDVGLYPSHVAPREEVLKEHGKVAAAEEDGVEDEEDLGGEIDDAPPRLSAAEMTQTHDEVGGLGGGVALGEAVEEVPYPGGGRTEKARYAGGRPLRRGLDPRDKGTPQADEGGLRDEREALVGWIVHVWI